MAAADRVSALLDVISKTAVLSAVPSEDGPARVIGTHSGNFHADEALACGMLKVLPEFADAPIVRSRDPATIAKCGIVVDVGGVFDPAALRFDHHQASFTDTYDATHTMTKLSSAGLVYRHFGKQVVRELVGPEVDDATVAKLVARTYDHFVEELDAVDNGVEVAEGPIRYRIGTGLSSRVGKLNPSWNETQTSEQANAAFRQAVAMTAREFAETVVGYKNHWLPAREIVKAALDKAAAVHPSGAVLVLDRFCPWKDHLFELEAEGAAPSGRALYVVFQDTSGSWRIQAVPRDPESFATRKPLPAAWAGLRDAELSAASGIPGGIFVHAGRFIGGNATYEGALQMAVASVGM
jgi:uncharacterized UPF0160 family protein